MSRTIKTAVVGPVSLSLPSDDPLTITKAGIITSASDGIDGADNIAWDITNSGLVSATNFAINISQGNVTNEKGGLITGYDGISDDSGEAIIGTVTNAGLISGTNAGIEIIGSVTNLSGGVISGNFEGVDSEAGKLFLENAGIITGGVHEQGGIITNDKSGTITGGIGGGGGNGVIVINSGLIEGDTAFSDDEGAAIHIQGDIVTNLKTGTISGFDGIYANWTSQIVINAGIIKGDSFGILLPRVVVGGSITNSGTISGATGIYFAGAGSMPIVNSGMIQGNFGDGIDLDAPGNTISITNQQGGSIIGEDGIYAFRVISVINQGNISGKFRGIAMTAGGVILNQKGATIEGSIGVGSGTGTITNAGTISGPVDSVQFGTSTTDNRLIIDPGAVFDGAADATLATISTIELAKGSGTISGIGNGNFIGFNFLDVDTGGQWKLTGANTMSTVLNDGSLTVSGSLFAGTVDPTSTGLFILTSGSTLEVSQALGTAASISFAKKSELVADSYASFGGSLLTNFGGDGTVDLKDFGFANISSSTLKSGSLTLLQVMNGTQQATLDFQSSGLGKGNFQFTSDQSGGVLITHA